MVTVAMVTRVGCEAENEVGDGKDGVSGGIAYIEGKAEQAPLPSCVIYSVPALHMNLAYRSFLFAHADLPIYCAWSVGRSLLPFPSSPETRAYADSFGLSAEAVTRLRRRLKSWFRLVLLLLSLMDNPKLPPQQPAQHPAQDPAQHAPISFDPKEGLSAYFSQLAANPFFTAVCHVTQYSNAPMHHSLHLNPTNTSPLTLSNAVGFRSGSACNCSSHRSKGPHTWRLPAAPPHARRP